MPQTRRQTPRPKTPSRDSAAFIERMLHALGGKAATKGYNQTGPDSANPLYEFVLETNGDHGHAVGEVIYKIRRWTRTKNDEDLEKAAAWLFLIWKHTPPSSGLPAPRARAGSRRASSSRR
jgi:hypothetical protein